MTLLCFKASLTPYYIMTLSSVRERAQQEAKRRLHQEQSMMEHARLRYMSLEDNKVIFGGGNRV